MNKRPLIIAAILMLFSISIWSQHMGAYIDYMDHFYVFDKGENTKLEDLRPQSFKVGGECVLYINSNGHLKMYQNKKVRQLEVGGVQLNNYFATDHLAGYNVFEKLKVVYKGEVIELSNRCTAYQAQDSLIAFYDKNLESLRVFYKGEIQDIESGMIGTPIQDWKSGDNIVAYISSRTKDFKIWYQGESTIIKKNVEDTQFKSGKDMVAYIDPIDESFKAFYKGEVYDIDDFKPQSFKMGDGFVAFVSHMGDFKHYGGDEVELISPATPEGYIAEDYSLAYIEDGRFYVWHNHEAVEVEGWVPEVYKVDWNTIAYVDNSNRIWIYQNGERKYLSNEFVNSFEIYRDLIHMNVKVDRNIIFYQDQFYEGESFYK